MSSSKKRWLAAAIAGLTLGMQATPAIACGCFAPPSPATPVVQAGERILFAQDGNTVTAHIQIQYQGAADDFGWLVPLPSVPTLELGTDELFTALGAATNPQYTLTTTRQFCGGGSSSSKGVGCGGFATDEASGSSVADAGLFAASDMGANNPALVVKASIGPYDYAVLKADDKTEMLKWLAGNHYYVPDATGQAVAPYIHTGAFFLALKLRAGESAGDIVPVVLHYTSDLPMIPITLTQVGATENMGVLVWLLGEARAIPRNYSHVVLDELPIWANPLNYPQLAVRAVREAPSHHAFLTEYAGGSSVMIGRLDYAGRFGDPTYLRNLTSPIAYVDYLKQHGYAFDATLYSLLEKHIPKPTNVGLSDAQYYGNLDYYYQGPAVDLDAGVAPAFDAAGLTDDIFQRIVTPDRAAAKLFDQHSYLTRLYTALSPVDMNLDPVFSQNPDLPNVSQAHQATLNFPCRGEAWLRTDTNLEQQWVSGFAPSLTLPAALRIERLREEGPPEIVTDNGPAIRAAIGPVDHGSMAQDPEPSGAGCNCNVHRGGVSGALGTMVLVAGAILLARKRRWS